MTTETTTPSITEIIARLGHACDEAWADCRGFYPAIHGVRMVCSKHRGHSGACESEDGHRWTQHLPLAPLPPTLAEWAAEWDREHPGETGPVAEWTDGHVSWSVDDDGVSLRVGTLRASRRLGSVRWTIGDSGTHQDHTRLGRLMQAVDGAR